MTHATPCAAFGQLFAKNHHPFPPQSLVCCPSYRQCLNLVFLVKVLGTIAFIVTIILIIGSLVLAIVSSTARFLLVIVEIRRFFCSVVIECGGSCRRRELCL